MTAVQGFRCFTSDLRLPNYGGEPVWYGDLPVVLTSDRLAQLKSVDSEKAFRPWWDLTLTLSDALSLGGLWPDGRSSAVFKAEAEEEDILERHADGWAVSKLRILKPVSREEIALAVAELSQVFGQHQRAMARSQLKWRQALSQPKRDPSLVQKGLEDALKRRGLSRWTTRQYLSASAVWNEWASWAPGEIIRAYQGINDWYSLAVYKIASDCWNKWAAYTTEDNQAVRKVVSAWLSREVFLNESSKADEAYGALVFTFAALQGWVEVPPDYLTVGLREAYYHGLALVWPTGPKELGWAMAP